MKQRITSKIIAFTFCISLSSTIAIAQQGMLSKVSLEDQVASSTLIVEGKVISKKSYWDVNHQNIYTVNEVEVYKVFKGQSLTTIEVVTLGGTVEFQAEQVSPSLELGEKDLGVFMLYENDKQLTSDSESNNSKFRSYSGVQGFYRYNVISNTAVNPFNIKDGILNLYAELETLTRQPKIEITNFDITNFTQSNSVLAVAITSISPTTSTAGTASVLTITGTGFGATQGTVGFANGDDGGATFSIALDSQVLTWTDTEITVEIPSKGGTGSIAVFHSSDATSDSSSEILTILYAESNAIFEPGGTGTGFFSYSTRHVDDNAAGGYTWQMQTDFDSNTLANDSFVRALETWRCETKVNWEIGATTATDVIASDGVNVIRFDIGAELTVGVLGRCTSRWSGCFEGGIPRWHVTELDIVFDDTTDWEYGPATAVSPKVDFETVAVHELGHGHQLAHVISPGAIMHYSISPGTSNRSLSTNDISGGNDVQSRSTTLTYCTTSVMTNYVCTASVADQLLAESIVLYPNPATNKLFIQNELFLKLETATIFDMSGRKLMTKDISESTIIDIKQLSQGVYFVNILSDNASTTKRFIVE